ncbi:MAG: hypothetical protein Q8L98_06480 [Chlamydiales bacterium]|nr:hypothetical protein [Chlamydiales bacterium]
MSAVSFNAPRTSFISELVPSRIWVKTYIIEPYLEGIERIRRAIHGKISDLFIAQSVSLEDRIIYLISGTSLLIPFFNSMLWFFMQIVSEPERLSRK